MPVSKRLRYEILRRDNHTCRYCGTAAPAIPLRIDHVMPVALGDTDIADNLVTSCEPCNNGKSSSTVGANRGEWGRLGIRRERTGGNMPGKGVSRLSRHGRRPWLQQSQPTPLPKQLPNTPAGTKRSFTDRFRMRWAYGKTSLIGGAAVEDLVPYVAAISPAPEPTSQR
ncbi:HNH endonuclease [Streptomyces venezuelae]|uniref:HNH endonuclease n=1 Tax=Streptomyces venezuelae TaxID=54571 RepID=UPI00332B2257